MVSMIERRTSRLGVVVLGFAAMQLALAAPALGHGVGWPWLVGGAACAVGIGLVLRARVARVAAGTVFAVCAAGAPISLLGALADGLPPGGWSALAGLAIGNAVATAALEFWLFVRAIQVLRGTSWRPSLVTARLAGAALTASAAYHLWLAVAVRSVTGIEVSGLGAMSVSLSSHGIELYGFAGWPIWHFVLGPLGLGLVVARRRIVERVATVLVAWLGLLVPLAALDAVRQPGGFGLFVVAFAAIPVYLAWWFRDELRRDAAAPPG